MYHPHMGHKRGVYLKSILGTLEKDMKPEDFVKRLSDISEHNGVLYGRTYLLIEEEEKHEQAILQYKGFLALSKALKCFVLETVELLNTECLPEVTTTLSEFYSVFVPRLSHSFLVLCGSEKAAVSGYPYQGYTQLRNVFDNLVLVSAALQNITDFYSIDGVEPGKPIDLSTMKKLRKSTEFEVRRKMTGNKSGLSKKTVEELAKLDALFDYETHGARLSLTQALNWMKGQAWLPVLPKFDESAFAMFMNRFCEVGWMTHRLIPAVQPPSTPLPSAWKEKWRIIDDSFERSVEALSSQLGINIGAAFVEFIKSKFLIMRIFTSRYSAQQLDGGTLA